MGDDSIEDHSFRSTLLRRYHPNNTVLTQPELQTTTKRHKLDSSIGDDLSSRRPSPILPNDLIVEILLKLPVKSLLQLRCVCKSWKTLISDPQFVNNHLRISTADPTLTHQQLVSSIITQHCKIVSCPVKPLFENPSTPVKPVSVKMSRKYHILGSCNGLLCLYDMYLGCVRLWNPCTRLRSKRSPTVVGTNAIIKYHGFGYDHVNDKYKMLAVVVDDLNVNVNLNESVTKLYTFGEKIWTTINNFPCNPTSWLGKFVNGTLNWFAKEGVSYNQRVILSFDLVKETYGKLLLPKQDEGGNICNSVLDVLSNCLCVCFDSNKTHWVLWLMKDYGVAESWTKLMIIPYEKIWNCRWMPSFKPLCISNNGVVLVKTLYYNLVLFDANNGRLHYRKICSKLGLDIHVYRESLVSPLFW